MEVLFYYIILQGLTTCFTYDVELEGIMRIGDAFLKELQDDLAEYKKLQTTFRPDKPIRPVKKYIGVGKVSKKSRKTGENEKRNKTYIGSFSRIKEDGFWRLDKLQVIVKNHLKINKNISKVIRKVSEEYSAALDKYFDSIITHVSETQLDIEFLILDLVETSNKMLYSMQRKIFNDVVDANKSKIPKVYITKATENIFKQSINDKKRHMNLICELHQICRPYPGFSDYFADLISEILKLSDSRLNIFLKILKNSLEHNIDFIHQIIDERALEKWTYHMSYLSTDMAIIRDIISILRTVITQRHKVVTTGDDKLKNRTAAMKILLDIIDKAFEDDGEDMIAMNIDIVVEALRHWTSRAQDIETIVTNFVKYFFNILKQSISVDTKQEIKVLTEVILKGKSKNRSIYKELLSKGSKFVRGEDLHIYSNLL
ncbi:hypothetical protein O3G_MSEX004304 [Manduca sexta]|uniref:Uncharacterized protein n=1 Tax=Manduca sexta TaxID=7130 RepID=A0A921YUW7_MANSE|nr:hypothetical protein O3G_MSEX004304 [Manduca sexta]